MQNVAQSEIRTSIRNYLTEELVPFNERVPDDARLEDYDLDSGQIVALVLFLEEQFQIQIADEDITIDNLGSVQALISFVNQKMK
jgi:acyl carrier protein